MNWRNWWSSGDWQSLVGLVSLVLAGCAPSPHSEFSLTYPIPVVCTTGMVGDVVARVGGEHVDVTVLMGEGVDPHLYKASPGDISKLNAASVIYYSGLHLEGKMGDMFVRMARKRPTFAVTERISPSKILETGEGAHDPHVWFDVELWSEVVGVVCDTLVELDPDHAEDYERRALEYKEELTGLHRYCGEQLAKIPKERRVLVTAHDAFHYFGRAYDVEVRAVQGISTDGEAGVREINELVDFIARRGIKAVFVESSVSERNIKALVEGCAARGHKVVIGGELFSDAMGKPGTPEGSYVGMVRHNVDTMVRALQ